MRPFGPASASEIDAVLERPLGGALQLDVDRQAKRLPRRRLGLEPGCALWAAARVDGQLRLPVLAAQVGVVGRLDAGLADRVGGLVALALQLLVLLRRDLADVAEHLGGERPVRIAAEEAVLHPHAGELAAVLVQVVDLVLLEAALHDDRSQRVVAVLLQLREHVLDARAGDQRQRTELRALRSPRLRQVGGPQLDARAGDVLDEQAAVTVEHRPARRVEADRAHAVVVRGDEVTVAGEHLQRPEPEEEDGEDGERERGEDRDAERKLRRQAIGLFGARVARQEAAGAAHRAASQGGAPPARGHRAPAAGRAGGSARRRGRSGSG